ncbi:MAG: flagellar assembly protein FliW [Acidobacteria bacterium]|nr:flagellar assembly protein FliW [Acidobacteriota bacterium]
MNAAPAASVEPDSSGLETMAVRPRDVVVLPDGLPGFERCRRFVVISSPDLAPLVQLRGLDSVRPSFLALDPRVVLPDYDTSLSPSDRCRLAVDEAGPLLWLALVRFDGDRLVANMRAPVVINPQRMIGRQVIPADSPYTTHHELTAG